MRWHLRSDNYLVAIVEADTPYDAVMTLRSSGSRDYRAEQPKPEQYPALWHLHFTRQDTEGVRRSYYTDLWVFSEAAWEFS